jgi:hypothetical protein
MIKALLKTGDQEQLDGRIKVYDYVIYQYDPIERTITAETVRRAFIDVAEEVGQRGANLMADQRSEPLLFGQNVECSLFLELIGFHQKDGTLEDIREVDND